MVREGLASVHEYSAQALPWAKLLFEAEVSSFLEGSHNEVY
jgi:hypothetical protein